MTYATCLERGSSSMDFSLCRNTQAAFDNCMMENYGMERPHYGYHSLPKIHDTDRAKPVEEKPAWMDFSLCRNTQAAFDNCMMENYGMERPHYGYHSLPKIHDTERAKPVEEKPAWMDNPKARKLDSLPENFPRTYQSWGMPGQLNQSGGEV